MSVFEMKSCANGKQGAQTQQLHSAGIVSPQPLFPGIQYLRGLGMFLYALVNLCFR